MIKPSGKSVETPSKSPKNDTLPYNEGLKIPSFDDIGKSSS